MAKRPQPTNVQPVGGSLVYRPSVFCSAVGVIACCHGKDIRLLNATTGNLVRKLAGHQNKVTGIAYDKSGNQFQLLSSSLDGSLKVWDLQDGACLDTISVGGPVLSVHLGQPMNESEKDKKVLYLAVNAQDEGASTSAGRWTFARYITHGKTVKLTHDIVSEADALEAFHGCDVSVSSTNGTRVAVISSRTIRLWFDSRPGKPMTVPHTITLTTAAWNPVDDILTTGDSAGQLVSWDLGDKWRKSGAAPVSSVLHWHSHGVGAAAYSPDGNYLLSGGEEAVLVIWQLRSGKRTFLPRLGGPIAQIASCGEAGNEFAVGLLDNSVSLFNMTAMEQRWRHYGLQLTAHHLRIGGVKRHRALPRNGLVFEPRSGNLVVQGVPGTLQFYDVEEERQRLCVNVTERQLAQRTDDESLQLILVELVCFSSDGARMVTGERRDVIRNPETREVIYHEKLALRFWDWNPQLADFELSTYVDAPHKAAMTSLLYHPKEDLVVSCSRDNTFKVWHRVDASVAGDMTVQQAATVRSSWACRSVGFYRGLPISSAAISPDGSLLAVGYEQVVTLWNPWTNEMQGGLTHTSHPVSSGGELVVDGAPSGSSQVKQICFLGDEIPFVVTSTVHGLYVWNLLSCALSWSLRMDSLGQVAPGLPGSGRFVATTQAADGASVVLVFHFESSTPLSIMPVEDGSLLAVSMGGRKQPRLYGLDSHRRLLRIGRAGDVGSQDSEEDVDMTELEDMSANKDASLLSSMFGAANVDKALAPTSAGVLDDEAAGDESKVQRQGEDSNVYATIPSHLLPTTRSLFQQLVFSKKSKSSETTPAIGDASPLSDGWLNTAQPEKGLVAPTLRGRASSVASVSQMENQMNNKENPSAQYLLEAAKDDDNEQFNLPEEHKDLDANVSRAFSKLFVSEDVTKAKKVKKQDTSGTLSTPKTKQTPHKSTATTGRKTKAKTPATTRRTRSKA